MWYTEPYCHHQTLGDTNTEQSYMIKMVYVNDGGVEVFTDVSKLSMVILMVFIPIIPANWFSEN